MCSRLKTSYGAEGGTRTRMRDQPRRFLRPMRLPIPPPRHFWEKLVESMGFEPTASTLRR